jgi:hypothetical protein
MTMDLGNLVGLVLLPALAGAASGFAYWLAAGRPRRHNERP